MSQFLILLIRNGLSSRVRGCERIRDKIAASKRKGLWVGGMAPLGYDTKDRRITVNEPEAETVRTIFRSYLKLGSLNLLRKNPAYHFKRIGLEAGPLSQWLFSALAEAGLPVICHAAHASGVEGAGQQDGPQRCAR